MTPQQEDEFRLKKANEHLAYCQEKENEARHALAQAVVATNRARDKYNALFLEVEAREVARRKNAPP